MKKKLIAGLSAAAVSAAALFGGLPYYFGGQAQKVLDDQYRLLQDSSVITIESRRYERGWFSSTETLVVRLKSHPAEQRAKLPARQSENRAFRAGYRG